MPYRLCGSDHNPLPSSLGSLLHYQGPPKLHCAEPHPWLEERWQRGSHNPEQLGTERAKSCIAPTPESWGPPCTRSGQGRAPQAGSSGNWGDKTKGTCVDFKARALSQLRLWVWFLPPVGLFWFYYQRKKNRVFVEARHCTVCGGPLAGDSESRQVPQRDTASAAFVLLQLQMVIQLLKLCIKKYAENKPQPPLPGQIQAGEAPHC